MELLNVSDDNSIEKHLHEAEDNEEMWDFPQIKCVPLFASLLIKEPSLC